MKITNNDEYIEYRIRVVSQELSECTYSYERNQIQIVELNKKIAELQTTVDEGFEMFSPIAGGERNFNNQEIKNLQLKMYLFASENEELQKKMNDIKDEIKVLKKLYRDNKNVSEKNINESLVDKLEDCVKYCDSDIHRVKIELNKLIGELKEG